VIKKTTEYAFFIHQALYLKEEKKIYFSKKILSSKENLFEHLEDSELDLANLISPILYI